MEPIELIMKIWGIKEEYLADVEQTLKTVAPQHLGLSLAMLGQPEDANDINTEAETWMDTNLPELRFV